MFLGMWDLLTSAASIIMDRSRFSLYLKDKSSLLVNIFLSLFCWSRWCGFARKYENCIFNIKYLHYWHNLYPKAWLCVFALEYFISMLLLKTIKQDTESTNMTGKINEEMTKFLQAGAMLPGRSFDPRDYKNHVHHDFGNIRMESMHPKYQWNTFKVPAVKFYFE